MQGAHIDSFSKIFKLVSKGRDLRVVVQKRAEVIVIRNQGIIEGQKFLTKTVLRSQEDLDLSLPIKFAVRLIQQVIRKHRHESRRNYKGHGES